MSARTMSYFHNFHHPPMFYVNNVKYINDYDIEEYRPQVQAFLARRRTAKREVPPKLWVTDDMGSAYQQIYYQQRMVPLEILYTEKHLQRLFETDGVNSQFIQSVTSEEYEKQMYEAICQKQIMNGSVVDSLDLPNHNKIVEEAQKLVKVFYQGDPLTDFEVDISRMYIGAKMSKHALYQKRKSTRYKVKWTLSDLNKYQDQVNYRMNDSAYFATSKPIFHPLDLDLAIKHLYTHMDIQKVNQVRRAFAWFSDVRAFERGHKRSGIQATALLSRSLMYLDSWEFVNAMDVENDFHINHSIANMHIWLLYQRLRDFSENKYAFQLREELIDAFNKLTNNEMQEVDVLRKQKKIDNIENYLFAIRRNFDFHFFINGKTAENPYFKLDALVWSSVFHEKVPRYSDKVYKMAEYMMTHYNYLKTLTYTDIEQASIEWSAYKVPFNYKNKLLRYNAPLSEEEFEKEYNTPYKIKKYHYNFRQEDELSEENLQKTFVNLCTNAFFHNKEKTVRAENFNLDSMDSKEKEEVVFRMKKQLEHLGQVPISDESFFSAAGKMTPIQTQFNIWKKNLFVPLADQLEEKAKRKVEEKEEKAQLEKEKESIWYEGKRDLYDPEEQQKRNEKHQDILRQHIAEERHKQGSKKDDLNSRLLQDSVDGLPIKKGKKKWRLW